MKYFTISTCLTSTLALQNPNSAGRRHKDAIAGNSPLYGISPSKQNFLEQSFTENRLHSTSLPSSRCSLTALKASDNNHDESEGVNENTNNQTCINDYVALDEIKAFANKYKELLHKDSQDLIDKQLNLLYGKASEEIENFNERHPEVVDSISDIIDEIDNTQERLEEIKDWLKDSAYNAPEFIKFNQTEEAIGNFTDRATNIPTKTNSFIREILSLFIQGFADGKSNHTKDDIEPN